MDWAGAPQIGFDVASDGDELDPPGRLERAPLSAALRPAGESLDRLTFEWSRLLADASEPNPFCEPWFMRAGLDHLAANADVRLLEVRSGAFLIGVLPLTIARRYGRFPVRNVQNWMHFHSFLGTPIVRAGQERRFWSAALDLLDGEPWAASFLHLACLPEGGPVHRGLAAAAAARGRRCEIVHRSERAFLQSSLGPDAYYEATVRKKKRKELKRLRSRLGELGTVRLRALAERGEIESWCDSFLALERGGWKGDAGSALACRSETERFFRAAIAGAWAAGRLDFLRLDLDRRPLAMLVNFMAPPGGFSFKIAFDEGFARFSPGVLIEIENLRILERPQIGWMDSCAAGNHPMIESLWGQRRALVRLSLPLARRRSRFLFGLCRAAEQARAAVRRTARPGSGGSRNG